MGKRLLSVILVLCVISAPFTAFATENTALNDADSVVEGIIAFEKSDFGAKTDAELVESLGNQAGAYSTDWYLIALSQYGINCRNEACVEKLKKAVAGFYDDGLEHTKVTDLQRTAFALMACGADITDIDGHNLLSDASYNRAKSRPLNAQGVNSVSYALLLLDSKDYKIPADAETTREEMLSLILEAELNSGGFALFGNAADIDITSIVIQALAPYMNRDEVKSSVEKSLEILSKRQLDSGAYKSFANQASCETTAQVVLALLAAGVNPYTDSRFIKDGNNLIDGLKSFRLENGSFSHFVGDNTDNMATYQSLMAFTALSRFLRGEKSFYDFTEKPVPPVVRPTVKPTKSPISSTEKSTVKRNKNTKYISKLEKTTSDNTEKSTEANETKSNSSAVKKSKKKVTKTKAEQLSTSEPISETTLATAVINSKPDKKENTPALDFASTVVLLIIYAIVFIKKVREK